MTWSTRHIIDRLPVAAGVAPDQLFADINGNVGVGTAARNQIESFYFARSVGRESPTLLTGIDKAETNRLRIQALNDSIFSTGRGYMQLPRGDWYVNGPVAQKDNVTIVGQGQGTRILSSYVGGVGEYFAGNIFWAGSYHTNNFTAYNKDTISAPAPGAETVTRTTTTLTIAAGDVVILFSNNDQVDRALRKVVSVSGSTVVLDKPLTHTWGGVQTTYYISKGVGGSTTITPAAGGSNIVIPHYLTKNTGLGDLTVVTDGVWQSRSGVMDGHFWNINVEKSDAMVYGNCFQDCRFDHFHGTYQTRAIEVADGGADNAFNDFHGNRIDNFTDVADPVIRIGSGSILRDFDFTDYTPDGTPRTGVLYRGNDKNCTIRDGRFRTKPKPNQLISIEQSGITIENVTVHVKPGLMLGDGIRFIDATDALIDNFRILGHTGYTPGSGVSGNYTIRVRTAVSKCRVDNIFDAHGSVFWQDTAPTNAQLSFGYLSWAP